MHEVLERFGVRGRSSEPTPACRPGDDGQTIVVTDGGHSLVDTPACRAAAIELLAGREPDALRVYTPGIERWYRGLPVTLLAAAGRFAALVVDHDATLADRTRRDPLAAAAVAEARPDPIATLAEETGLKAAAGRAKTYERAFRPAVKPTIAHAAIYRQPPDKAVCREQITLTTGGTARVYDRPDAGTPYYHVEPPELAFDPDAVAALADAYDWLAESETATDVNGPIDAVRTVRDDLGEVPIRRAAAVLEKHTTGYGIIEEFFADDAISDVYATAPAAENRLWVIRGGEQMQTNARLSTDGAAAIASRLRRESGRSFSRAAPTLDASATVGGTDVRVAGVSTPATDGRAFAFRTGGAVPFTLPKLVANGTVPAAVAGLLSVAVRRDAAILVAGARGAGKTTLLGALLWELSAGTRTITIEDTPELPVDTLQHHGRNVQPLRATLEEGPGIDPQQALRTALRLGESALVVGEVRGPEARVLYEAMRVGASGAAVLGTIHGDTGADVKERVTADLDVPESSFAATDLLVTVEAYRTPTGDRGRRIKLIEEVVGEETVRFEPLYRLEGPDEATVATAVTSGRIERGNSHLVETLTRPEETYAAVHEHITDRGQFIDTLATRGEHAPAAVTTAYARQKQGTQ